MGIFVPPIQIRQQSAKLGIDINRGHFDIRQPQADLSIETTPAKMDIRQPAGKLEIDQSKAWDALSMGSITGLNQRIYSQAKDIALQGVARIVENGNRMAAIHQGGNPIAEIAAEEAFSELQMVYPTAASSANVDIRYTANKPEIRYQPADVQVEIKMNKPEITYHPANVSFYLRQKNSIEFIPPQIDYKL